MGYHDMDLTDQVRANLRRNRELSSFRISVSVRNGIVHLSGHVSSQAREEAMRIAQGVEAVAVVVDEMTINPAA